jgi:hypothetical protein
MKGTGFSRLRKNSAPGRKAIPQGRSGLSAAQGLSLFDSRLPSEAKALKICGIYGTAEAVPFLRESFRTSATFGFCLLSKREAKAQRILIIYGATEVVP